MKSEIVLYTGLSSVQKRVYKAILTKDLCKTFYTFEVSFFLSSFLSSLSFPSAAFGGAGNKTRLMNVLSQLRKCINHPYLFDG